MFLKLNLYILLVPRRSMRRVCGAYSTSLRPGKAVSFEEMLRRLRAFGYTVSDLNLRPSRDEQVAARPTFSFLFRGCIDCTLLLMR